MTIKELENELTEAITIIKGTNRDDIENRFDSVCNALDEFKDSIIKYLEENK